MRPTEAKSLVPVHKAISSQTGTCLIPDQHKEKIYIYNQWEKQTNKKQGTFKICGEKNWLHNKSDKTSDQK